MLTTLIPVTRPETREAVCAAIAASDIPRERMVLIQDAPGCDAWVVSLQHIGFVVESYRTTNGPPLQGRLARRPRHRIMRQLSQMLVPDGPLLCIEDDILVPPDIYARLSAIGPHATGIQIARHECRRPVIYPAQGMREGIHPVDGCGMGCLLTTGEAYRAAILTDDGGAIDEQHTAHMRPLLADFDCVCGHITEEGVLWPTHHPDDSH